MTRRRWEPSGSRTTGSGPFPSGRRRGPSPEERAAGKSRVEVRCEHGRGHPVPGGRGRRGVHLRHVRGDARQTVRQAGACRGPRRSDGRRRRVRRVRRRTHGSGPCEPGHPGHSGSRLLHATAVATQRGRHAVRSHRGGRVVAVRPPGDPPAGAGVAGGTQPGAQVRLRGRILAGGPGRRRRDPGGR